MNDSTSRPRIVVGADGSDAALTAARYAASEATRIDADLEIVHASPTFVNLNAGPVGYYPLTPTEYRGIGLKVLKRARKAARKVAGDAWPIGTSLIEGPAAAALTAAADGARLLVLGDQRRSLLDRLITGSVVNTIAGSSPVPVVVVPETWRDDEHLGVVTVGLRDAADGDDLIRAALAIAAERDAKLRILHAWKLPALYDDIIVTRIDTQVWGQQTRTEIDEAVSRVSGDHPEVSVEVQLVHAQPARALVAASRESDLLVIARRGSGLRHLGSTGKAVLRESRCPVEVVLPSAKQPENDRGRTADPALVA